MQLAKSRVKGLDLAHVIHNIPSWQTPTKSKETGSIHSPLPQYLFNFLSQSIYFLKKIAYIYDHRLKAVCQMIRLE